MEKFEDKARITGIGASSIGRRLNRDPLSLTMEACLAALKDAGLDPKDIDGVTNQGGGLNNSGYSGAGISNIINMMRLQPRWFGGGLGDLAGHAGTVVNAAMAIAAGMCRHVLVFRCTWESTARMRDPVGRAGTSEIEGDLQWQVPFGAFSAANWIAPLASRHMHLYGTTREQLGAIALTARKHASLNPNAIYRDPLTMDDYLNARMISEPFGLYDCDVPCDGAIAVVVSAADAARDTRRPNPLRLEAVGTQIVEPWSWDQGDLSHEPLLRGAGRSLWERTDLKPKDVDVALLYDGFTFNCLCWIEALGFCPEGEGGRFVEGGSRIALDGELPLNPHGGQLSAGRMQGYGFLHEACVQLWGEGGDRQVPNNPDVAAVATGGGIPGGALLLTRD
jgi:acetyl-CoA acetyltransferase